MGGHRKTSGKPLARSQRTQRRMDALAERVDSAGSPAGEFMAAVGFVQGAAKHAPEAVAAREFGVLVTVLRDAGIRMLAVRKETS